VTFTITHRYGEQVEGDESMIPALVAELEGPLDDEHPDVAVTDDDSDWSLSAFQSSLLVFENVEDDDVGPRHIQNVTRAEAIRVMTLLARGNLAEVESLEWQPGYFS